MSDREGDDALLHAAPVFCVTDMAAAMAYMTDRLGFRVQGTAGDPPAWASLQRDRVEIMLARRDCPVPAQDWAAYLRVRDADALYRELLGRGADIVGPPRDMPYGCREFEVRLPDGRRLAFGADLTGA
jgi:predicted enzyme related to lactoylglutathione lyase